MFSAAPSRVTDTKVQAVDVDRNRKDRTKTIEEKRKINWCYYCGKVCCMNMTAAKSLTMCVYTWVIAPTRSYHPATTFDWTWSSLKHSQLTPTQRENKLSVVLELDLALPMKLWQRSFFTILNDKSTELALFSSSPVYVRHRAPILKDVLQTFADTSHSSGTVPQAVRTDSVCVHVLLIKIKSHSNVLNLFLSPWTHSFASVCVAVVSDDPAR